MPPSRILPLKLSRAPPQLTLLLLRCRAPIAVLQPPRWQRWGKDSSRRRTWRWRTGGCKMFSLCCRLLLACRELFSCWDSPEEAWMLRTIKR